MASSFHAPFPIQGEVPEWLNGTDSKSVVGVTLPGVRIPPSPPRFARWASPGGSLGFISLNLLSGNHGFKVILWRTRVLTAFPDFSPGIHLDFRMESSAGLSKALWDD